MGVRDFEAVFIDRSSNTPIAVRLRMDMQPEEVAEQVRRRLNTDQPVEFVLRRPDGEEYEIATPDARTVWEIMQGGSQIFVNRRPIYGSSKFLRDIEELKKIYRSVFYNQSMNACIIWGKSRVDNREYQVTVYGSKNPYDYSDTAPLVIIKPFPYYVKEKAKYQDNDVNLCCKQKGEQCVLHIDDIKWNEIKARYINPLIGIIENIIQALDIEPFRIY